MAVPSKYALRKTIRECGGVIAEVARAYKVDKSTVYRWLDKKDLRAEVTDARVNMHDVADDVTYARLMSDDEDKAWDAAKFVKLHLDDRGNLLNISPRIMALLLRMGISKSEVVEQFEALIEQIHAEHTS